MARIEVFLARLAGFVRVLVLAALLLSPMASALAPTAIAPIGPARAGATVDSMAKCLDGIATVYSMAGDAAEAAAKIAEAAADPVYTQCLSEVGAGNVVTAAFMAAVTTWWATSGTPSWDSVDDCRKFIKNEAMTLLVTEFNDLLFGGGFVGDLMNTILPDPLIDMIKNIVNGTAKDLIDQLYDALGPVTHLLDCGCTAAVTASIVKDGYEAIAAKADEALDGLGGCLDILKDPLGFISSVLDDPVGAIKVVGKAVCDGVEKIGVDVCGAFSSAAGVVVGLLEDVGEAAWNGLKSVGCAVIGWGCDDDEPPPPPPTCSTDPKNANSIDAGCVCPGGTGLKVVHLQWDTCGSDGKKFEDLTYAEQISCKKDIVKEDRKYCGPCGAFEIINGFGACEACPAGLKPGADGKCSQVVTCNKKAGEFLGADGHTCKTCPAGSHLAADGHCDADAPNCSAWPWLTAQSGKTPPTTGVSIDGSPVAPAAMAVNTAGDGKDAWCGCPPGKTNTGTSCAAPPPPAKTCPFPWQQPDPATGKCVDRCAPDSYWGVPISGGDVKVDQCIKCGGDRVAYANVCSNRCQSDEVRRFGQCQTCPTGMQPGGKPNSRGELTSCVDICKDGESYLDGTCAPRCAAGEVRREMITADGKHHYSCGSCPDGSKAGGERNTAGEALTCESTCPPGSGFGKYEGPTFNFSAGGQIKGSASASTISACFACPANSYAKTTSTSEAGVTYQETVCAPCPTGEVSDPGSSTCRVSSHVVVTTPGGVPKAPSKRILEKPLDKPEKPKREEGPSRLEKRSNGDERPRSSGLDCRAGMVPNAAGTRCVPSLDADEDRGGSGGSRLPSQNHRSPSGGGFAAPMTYR